MLSATITLLTALDHVNSYYTNHKYVNYHFILTNYESLLYINCHYTNYYYIN